MISRVPGRAILARHLLQGHEPAQPGPVAWALGAAMLVRSKALRAAGGLGERIFLFGDGVDSC